MKIIQLVKTPHCAVCARVRKMIDAEVKPLFPDLEVEEFDAITPQGQEMVLKYGIMTSPGVIINGELFSMGGADKEALIKKLKELP